MATTAKGGDDVDSRIVAHGVMWLGTSGLGALYGRFLDFQTLTTAIGAALIALLTLYVWCVLAR